MPKRSGDERLTHHAESLLLYGLTYPLHVTHTHNTLSRPRTNKQRRVETTHAKHAVLTRMRLVFPRAYGRQQTSSMQPQLSPNRHLWLSRLD
jgi:hypothetical protein